MKLDKIILLFLLLVLPGIMYFYLTTGYNNFIKLEVIGEADYSIDDFSFINQNNDTITKDSMTGSIYVANFFFTSCPTICPKMTRNMSYLQDKLSVFPNIRFLSHTVDPFNDTPEKLLSYVDSMKQKNIYIINKILHLSFVSTIVCTNSIATFINSRSNSSLLVN